MRRVTFGVNTVANIITEYQRKQNNRLDENNLIILYKTNKKPHYYDFLSSY